MARITTPLTSLSHKMCPSHQCLYTMKTYFAPIEALQPPALPSMITAWVSDALVTLIDLLCPSWFLSDPNPYSLASESYPALRELDSPHLRPQQISHHRGQSRSVAHSKKQEQWSTVSELHLDISSPHVPTRELALESQCGWYASAIVSIFWALRLHTQTTVHQFMVFCYPKNKQIARKNASKSMSRMQPAQVERPSQNMFHPKHPSSDDRI